jgi:RNA polymerase sigma factor (sigma-70 family)
MNDWQLIQEWVDQRSESAFSQLVDRHIGFVHACARRQLNNSESAKEVTQSVFILLSEKAGSFREGIILPSWLFRTTRFLAARMLRSENRRKSHETKAASMNSASDYHSQTDMDDLWIRMEPHMDSALGSLPPGERDAIILRFFQQKAMREVGQMMGISEEAAKKRVKRGLERFKVILSNRGVQISIPAMVLALSNQPAEAVPAMLGKEIFRLVVNGASVQPVTIFESFRTGLSDISTPKSKLWPTGAMVLLMAFCGLLISGLTRSKSTRAVEARLAPSAALSKSDVLSIPAYKAAGAELVLQLVDDSTSQPVSGAQCRIRFLPPYVPIRMPHLRSDTNGLITVEAPKGSANWLQVWVSAAGYAPVFAGWQGYEITGDRVIETIRLQRGYSIAGDVQDEMGNPVDGATVVMGPFMTFFDERVQTGFHTDLSPISTDAAGHFWSDQAPSPIPGDGYKLSVTHPDFIRTTIQIQSLSQFQTNQVIVLHPGIRVQGRVTSIDGVPISNADVAEHHQRMETFQETETDGNGEFELGPFSETSLPLRIEAKGFISLDTNILVSKEVQPLEITLQPEQPNASISQKGNRATPLRVYGQVLDAETFQPVTKFKVLQDNRNEGWKLLGYGNDGAFDWRPTIYTPEISLIVEAEGFVASQSDWRKTGPEDQNFKFLLRKHSAICGTVLRPEGTPAEGAQIGLGNEMFGWRLQPPLKLLPTGQAGARRATSKADGSFVISPELNMRSIVIVHESGCAVLPADDATNILVRLKKWGGVRGKLVVNGKMASHSPVWISPALTNFEAHFISFDVRLDTDANGNFSFERVPPGQYMVARIVDYNHGGEGNIGITHGQIIEVLPGTITEVSFNSGGRTVVGQFKFSVSSRKLDWHQNLPYLQENRSDLPEPKKIDFPIDEATYNGRRNRWDSSMRRYYLRVAGDNTFSVQGVPAGNYVLHCAAVRGDVRRSVAIPSRADSGERESVDLGVIDLEND